MRGVARLVLSYFSPTPLLRAFSVLGLALIVVSFFLLCSLPQSTLTIAPGIIGFAALFLGTALMPVMFGRTARSPLINVLPHGRIKLLASAFMCTALVSLPVPILDVYGFQAAVGGLAVEPKIAALIHSTNVWMFWIIFTTQLVAFGWLYLAVWFVMSERNTGGLIRGLLVVIVVVFAPTKQIKTLDASLMWNIAWCAATWGVFGCGFLLWPRWKVLRARLRPDLLRLPLRAARESRARELDLFLGTARPWMLSTAMIIPIVLATRIGFYSPAVWVYYLTIFSTVAGAIAGRAAERSRPVWLRARWSRQELFAEVERSFWRHNGWVLAVLLVLMIAVGAYSRLPLTLLAIGLPLLTLGTTLSTYLGLMTTRGLHWLEASLGVGVMLALMAAAVLAARSDKDLDAVIAIEILLTGLAFVLRSIAKRRWQRLDWMQCRPDRGASVRHAS